MKKGYQVVLLGMLFVFSNCSIAQKTGDKVSSTNKKAVKYYLEGEKYYDSRDNELAEINFIKALEKDPNFVEAELMLAYVYQDAGEYEKAIVHYVNSIKIDPNFFPESYSSAGILQLQYGRYEEAKANFESYLAIKGAPLRMKPMAEDGLRTCNFAINAIKNPVPFTPINMGAEINSKLPEYFPCFTADGATILYTRRLNDERTYTGFNEDFYISSFNKGKWTPSQNVKYINSMNNEGAPTMSANGRFLIFTSCDDPVEGYGKGRKGNGSCDLFYAYKIGDNWTNPKNLNMPISSVDWESQPSFSADGKTLYFVRGKRTRGGVKYQDIWMSELSERGTWSKPTRLSNTINTSGREVSVFIHPDGKTLYFASDGHPGMGGLDIFMSRKGENGEWTTPVNLGYPINTHHNENSFLVSADGKLAYFASNREGGYGDLDLYQFNLPEKMRPEPVTYMTGKTYDKGTKIPLGARFELIDLETGNVVVRSYADRVTGEYLVCLPSGKDYALNVSSKGYLFYSENFTLTHGTLTEPYKKNVPLNKIKAGEKVVLKNVFFDTDKFDLKPTSKAELDKLVAFLQLNETMVIELSGHTDNVGNKKANQILSQNRAKAVKNYLLGKGILEGRLIAKGYGDTLPIATNDTEEGRAENRRTEFKVIGE